MPQGSSSNQLRRRRLPPRGGGELVQESYLVKFYTYNIWLGLQGMVLSRYFYWDITLKKIIKISFEKLFKYNQVNDYLLMGSKERSCLAFIIAIKINKSIQIQSMKRRIATELLSLHQTRARASPHPFLSTMTSLSYQLATDIITDVKRPFTRICIHGPKPQLILPFLQQHNHKFNIDQGQYNVTLVDFLRSEEKQRLRDTHPVVKEIRYIGGPDSWIAEENSYDLLISSLQSHHANQPEVLFSKYLRSLQPDGALVGTNLVEGTLKELYWAYILAQNQRFGGMSPKVLPFPAIGQTGTFLTNVRYQLITILQHQQIFQLQSFVDLLTLLQELGESGYLRGRRKGVYKDLLLAAGALYHSQWAGKDQTVQASLSICKYIAWKFHQNQPKKLKPGPHVGSVQFSDELRKFGDQVENYVVSQDSSDPQRID